MREPQVVRTPWVQKMSLWAIGTPVRAPPAPAASARSAAAASASACSRVTEMKALSAAWLASILSRYARTSSTLENFLARRPAASCVSVLVCQSLTRASFDHHVRPQALRQAGKRMRHRSDARGVGAIQGADEVENPRQAVLVHRDLG